MVSPHAIVTPDVVLHAEHLRKTFGRSVAVDDVSLTVHRGEILGLLGPNGAGKTTTIQLLLGITGRTAGRITIFGRDFDVHRSAILARTNASFAATNLPWRLTVQQNLTVYALLYGIRNRRKRIGELLERFGILEFAHREIAKLSAGQISRVNLCKALLNDPELLLLDEPTASLDPVAAAQLRVAIRELKDRGTAVLYTSHDMREVEELCDRVVFIHHGHMLDEGSPRDLARRQGRVRLRLRLTNGATAFHAFAQQRGWTVEHAADGFTVVLLHEGELQAALTNILALPVTIADLDVNQPSLEEYFIEAASSVVASSV
ncbi:ABC transporter ATP-binding protein [Candidatus Uhrbacteria bacterium]|nr:ABC transporter ATP-binding protein [Candidatus Uhrbacteria bacterium]